jgi:hypothetical protein
MLSATSSEVATVERMVRKLVLTPRHGRDSAVARLERARGVQDPKIRTVLPFVLLYSNSYIVDK